MGDEEDYYVLDDGQRIGCFFSHVTGRKFFLGSGESFRHRQITRATQLHRKTLWRFSKRDGFKVAIRGELCATALGINYSVVIFQQCWRNYVRLGGQSRPVQCITGECPPRARSGHEMQIEGGRSLWPAPVRNDQAFHYPILSRSSSTALPTFSSLFASGTVRFGEATYQPSAVIWLPAIQSLIAGSCIPFGG